MKKFTLESKSQTPAHKYSYKKRNSVDVTHLNFNASFVVFRITFFCLCLKWSNILLSLPIRNFTLSVFFSRIVPHWYWVLVLALGRRVPVHSVDSTLINAFVVWFQFGSTFLWFVRMCTKYASTPAENKSYRAHICKCSLATSRSIIFMQKITVCKHISREFPFCFIHTPLLSPPPYPTFHVELLMCINMKYWFCRRSILQGIEYAVGVFQCCV